MLFSWVWNIAVKSHVPNILNQILIENEKNRTFDIPFQLNVYANYYFFYTNMNLFKYDLNKFNLNNQLEYDKIVKSRSDGNAWERLIRAYIPSYTQP